MSYSDPNYNVRAFELVGAAISLSTATAGSTSGANVTPSAAYLPKFIQRTKVHKVRVQCTTIPDDGSTNLKAHFLNGTDTFAVVTLTTATAGQWLDATMTEAYSTIDDDIAPTIKVTGTATASGDANGSFNVWFDMQKVWDTDAE